VAFEAGFLKDGPDVLGVGHVWLRGGRRQFGFGGEQGCGDTHACDERKAEYDDWFAMNHILVCW
jgi:hypothetical protein